MTTTTCTAALLDIVEGWTQTIGPFTLKVNGAPINLTGFTITLSMHRASGAVVVPGGVITLLNQGTNPGQLTYTPVASDFIYEDNQYTIEQPYQLHWKVVDGASKVVYFPSGAPAIINVWRA